MIRLVHSACCWRGACDHMNPLVSSVRAIPQAGQCEAYDWLPTADGDDAVYVQCQNVGKRVVEEMPLGGTRTRIVCGFHRGETRP